MLMQTGPNAPLAMAALGLEDPQLAGRFRDAYFTREDGEIVVALFTRNGGNNRACWEENPNSEFKDVCACPGCIQTKHLPTIPTYIRDYDDDFDNTYCTTLFTLDSEIRELLESTPNFDLEEAANEEPPMERLRGLIARMESGELESEEMNRAHAVSEQLAQQLEQSFVTGEGGEVNTQNGGVVIVSGFARSDEEPDI
jgi:hypothetical protein